VPPEANGEGDAHSGGHRWRKRALWAAAGAALLAGVVAVVLLLVLSPTAGRVTVPEVTGRTQAAAVGALRRAGLQPVVSLVANARVASGRVIGTTPPRGTIVGKGSRVSVFVSSGPGSLALPNVNNKKSDEAVKILREKGFEPTTQSQPSDTVGKGLVISTDPTTGVEVQVGSPVTVLVSSGPAEVSVPNVTNESQANATATLAAAGLKVTVLKREAAEPQAGTVVSQSPSAGSRAKVGSQVTIVVAQALKRVAVPNVVGQSEAQAVGALGNAGFASRTVSRTVTDPTKAGTVVQQSPAAGRKLIKGAVVTIAVGALGQQTTSTSTSPTPPPATPPPAATPPSGG
jgi:serine/threonine-protein kinase